MYLSKKKNQNQNQQLMIFEATIAISDSKDWLILYRLQLSEAQDEQIWASTCLVFQSSKI